MSIRAISEHEVSMKLLTHVHLTYTVTYTVSTGRETGICLVMFRKCRDERSTADGIHVLYRDREETFEGSLMFCTLLDQTLEVQTKDHGVKVGDGPQGN